MAKFVTVVKDGAYTIELEGNPGEEVTAEQTLAYAHLHAAYNLGQISEQLATVNEQLGYIADAIEND